MGMIDLADHIIARAQKTNIGITNLQLQKVLYFSIINGLKEGIIDKNWLTHEYNDIFLVWRYGPVVKDIYEKYSIFGASKIFISKSEIDNYKKLNKIIDNLLDKNVFELVNISHQHSHWKYNEKEIIFGRSDIPYTMEDIINAAQE